MTFEIPRKKALFARNMARHSLEKSFRFKQRNDPVFYFVVLCLVIFLGGVGIFTAFVQLKTGIFDPPTIRPLPDERLLSNIRSEESLKAGSIVAAAHLPIDDKVAVLRSDGLLHTFDTNLSLWADDDRLMNTEGINSAFNNLSPACSAHSRANPNCEGEADLFAYSEEGGLVFRDDDQWRTVLSDTKFIGVSGEPVEHESWAGVAVSEDRSWLLIATKTEGLGLYNLTSRSWHILEKSEQNKLLGGANFPQPIEIVSAGQEFLIATKTGLSVLSVDRSGDIETSLQLAQPDGEILDIANGNRETLILGKSSCSGGDCLGIYRYSKGGSLTPLIAETALYPALSQGTVARALLSTDTSKIFTLGSAGVYQYDRNARSWLRLLNKPATYLLEAPNFDGLYFSYEEGVGFLRPSGNIQTWKFGEKSVQSLARNNSGVVFAQTADNSTYVLHNDLVDPILLTRGNAHAESLSKLRTAVAAFNQLVMIGEKYLLLHDPEKRTYHSISKALLDQSILFQNNVKLIGGSAIMWAINGRTVEAFELANSSDLDSFRRIARTILPDNLKSINSEGNTLRVVASSGIPYAISVQNDQIAVQQLTGSAKSTVGTAKDVIKEGRVVYIANDRAVSVYSEAQRGFGTPIPMPINERINDIALADGQLYMLGELGNIVAAGSEATLTGAQISLPFGSDDITDATRLGAKAYLVAKWGVAVYSFNSRRVDETFPINASRQPILAGVINGIPATFDGQNAWFGSTPLAIDRARVISASNVGNTISTVQESSNGTRLVMYNTNGANPGKPVCYFANPGPGNAEILDVTKLPNSAIAVLGKQQIWVRDREYRRFVGFKFSQSGMSDDTRLTLLGNHLVAHDGRTAKAIPLNAIRLTDSCSSNIVDLTKLTTTLQAKRIALSQDRNQIWLLSNNAEVSVWQNGTVRSVLSPQQSQVPQPSTFQSTDFQDKVAFFAGNEQLWTYDTNQRSWSRQPLNSNQVITKTDVWHDGRNLLLTSQSKNGLQLGGVAQSSLDRLELKPLRQKPSARLGFAPSEIVDVATFRNSDWLFLGQKNIAFLQNADSSSPKFHSGYTFNKALDERSVWEQNGVDMILEGDQSKPARIYIPIDDDGKSATSQNVSTISISSFVPLEGEEYTVLSDRTILRHFPNGQVDNCSLKSGAASFSACDSILPPALLMDGDKIAQAFRVTDQIWILRNEDLKVWLLDRPKRKIVQIADGIEDIRAFFDDGKNVFLVDSKQRLHKIDIAKANLTLLDEDVRAVKNAGSDFLVQTSQGARLVGRDFIRSAKEIYTKLSATTSTSDVANLDIWGENLAGMRIAQGGGSTLFTLSAAGRIVSDDLLSLPGATDVKGPILQVGKSRNNRWYLRTEKHVYDVGRDICKTIPPASSIADDVVPLPSDDEVNTTKDTPSDLQEDKVDKSTEEALDVKELECLSIWSQVAVPEIADLGGLPVLALLEGEEAVLNGIALSSAQCQPIAPTDNDEGQALSHTVQTQNCQFSSSEFERPPHLDINPNLQNNQSPQFVESLDVETGQLDATSLSMRSNQILISAGNFSIKSLNGSLARSPVNAAEATSFRWDRTDNVFVFNDHNNNEFSVAAQVALPNGRFAFAEPGRAVMINPSRYMVANKYGTWIYSMNSPNQLTWQAMSLPSDTAHSARGRVFYTDNRSVGPTDDGLQNNLVTNSYTIGALSVQADVMNSNVEAYWSDGNEQFQAFSRRGFSFDERADLVVDGGDAWLRTPLGMFHVAQFDKSGPAPPDEKGKMKSWRNDAYYLSDSGNWYQFENQNWLRREDPLANRTAATEPDLEWNVRDGKLVTESPISGAERRRSLRFERDVLIDAAYGLEGLLTRLADGIHVHARADQLTNYVAVSSLGPSENKLVVRKLATGVAKVTAVSSNGLVQSVWNGSNFDVPNEGDNPDISRVAIEYNWMRVRFARRAPIVELSLEDLSGGKNWSEIRWRSGNAMPFDYFTAMRSVEGKLYAGSSIGLQIFSANGSSISAERFIDTRKNNRAYDAITRIGIPMDSPSEIYILGKSSCVRRANQSFNPCNNQNALLEENLGGNSFWQWLRDGDRVGFFYKDAAGGQLTEFSPAPRSGYFPHDLLDDHISCNGQFQTWNGIATQLQGSGMINATNFEVEPATDLYFTCQERSVQSSKSEPNGLASGLYIQGRESWAWDNGGPRNQQEFAEEINLRRNGGMPLEAVKLRIKNDFQRNKVSFQYRRKDTWENLAQNDNRLAVDQRDALIFAEGHFWAFTPAGFIQLDSTKGRLDLNPDTAILTPTLNASETLCRFDAIETADGNASYIPISKDGPQTFVRCKDGRIFASRLNSASETRLFAEVDKTNDPFLQREIYDDEVLKIVRKGRSAGRSGTLTFSWRNETNALLAGRFALDNFSKTALIQDDKIDIISDMGWTRQNRTNLKEDGAQRPANRQEIAKTMNNIGVDEDVDRLSELERKNSLSLCLSDTSGAKYIWHTDGRFVQKDECAPLMSFDGLYAYRGGIGGIIATARGLNGTQVVRRLIDGRFNDHTISGEALISNYNERRVIIVAGQEQIVMFDTDTLQTLGEWAWIEKPETLYMGDNDKVIVYSDKSSRRLSDNSEGGCSRLSEISNSNEGLIVKGLTKNGDKTHLRVIYNSNNFDIHLSCENQSHFIIGDRADVESRQRYDFNRVDWGRPTAYVDLAVNDDIVTHFRGKTKNHMSLSKPPLFNRQVGDQFIVVTSEDIFSLNVDSVMSDTSNGGSE